MLFSLIETAQDYRYSRVKFGSGEKDRVDLMIMATSLWAVLSG